VWGPDAGLDPPASTAFRQDQPVLLAEVVATSERVRSTRSRSAKVSAMAGLLGALGPEEVEAAAAFLAGEARHGPLGVGWATIAAVEVVPRADATLTVTDLDVAIAALAALGGPGSAGARARLLHDLFGRATAAEADFIRRLLLGDLRQGALEGVMTDAVSRAARVPVDAVRRAVMLSGNLHGVAEVALTSGENGLSAIGLRVLTPVRPMLASTAADVTEALGACGLSSVEWKLDGARVQVHRRGERVALFPRNLNDVTGRLPGVVAVVRSLPVDQVVLDGEVIGSGEGDRPRPFQETMSRFGRHAGGDDGLLAGFFDCLHLDGTDLLDRPLVERLGALETAAAPWRVPTVLTEDPGDATTFLDGALEAGHEGVVVKAAGSRYEAGRRGGAWRKVKPVRTFDLVVLAAEWGHGRRRGWLSNLHLGARDPAGGFLMVGKTFKGLTDEVLTWQTGRLLELEVARVGIVVEVRPELVVEVALDGVQASTRYPGQLALRFARVKRYRPDKDPTEADTIDSLRTLLR
jgi:DNA ligase-1